MLEGLTPPQKEHLCPIMQRAAKLDKKDLEALLSYFADPRWTNDALAEALTKAGFKVGSSPLWKHRAGKCACARAH